MTHTLCSLLSLLPSKNCSRRSLHNLWTPSFYLRSHALERGAEKTFISLGDTNKKGKKIQEKYWKKGKRGKAKKRRTNLSFNRGGGGRRRPVPPPHCIRPCIHIYVFYVRFEKEPCLLYKISIKSALTMTEGSLRKNSRTVFQYFCPLMNLFFVIVLKIPSENKCLL